MERIVNDLSILLSTTDNDPEFLYRSRLITVLTGIIQLTRLTIFEEIHLNEHRRPSEFLNYFYAQLGDLQGTLSAYQGIMREMNELD